jgi:hypothetical protein
MAIGFAVNARKISSFTIMTMMAIGMSLLIYAYVLHAVHSMGIKSFCGLRACTLHYVVIAKQSYFF